MISDGTTKTTGLTKTGTGTLTLSGANTYSGATTASAGTLELGNFSAAGTGSLIIGDATTVRVTAAGSGALGNSNTRVLRMARPAPSPPRRGQPLPFLVWSLDSNSTRAIWLDDRHGNHRGER